MFLQTLSLCVYVCLSICISVLLFQLLSHSLWEGFWLDLADMVKVRSSGFGHGNRLRDDIIMIFLCKVRQRWRHSDSFLIISCLYLPHFYFWSLIVVLKCMYMYFIWSDMVIMYYVFYVIWWIFGCCDTIFSQNTSSFVLM